MVCQPLRMKFQTTSHPRRSNWPFLALVVLGLMRSSLAASPLDITLTTNVAPAGFVEVTGVEAGEFNPLIWQAATLNFVPDLRFPLLAPQSGKFRNIYAPSAVETPAGYRLFYGAWDGIPSGNDHIYSATTDVGFQDFSNGSSLF